MDLNLGDKITVCVDLSHTEISYLKEYFKLIEIGGIDSVASACHDKAFAITPFNNIIGKLLKCDGKIKMERPHFFQHIITTLSDNKEVVKRFESFHNQSTKGYEIVEINLKDVLNHEFKKRDMEPYWYTSLRSSEGEKDLSAITERILVIGRKYKQLLIIKCDSLNDINDLSESTKISIITSCVGIDKENICYMTDYNAY